MHLLRQDAGKRGIEMKAGVFVEPGRVEVNNEVPIPKVEGENEAVIRRAACMGLRIRTSGGSAHQSASAWKLHGS